MTIQECGKEILNNKPGKFYIFVGSEYGVKEMYLTKLKAHYGDYAEAENISDIFNIMKTKQLIPLKPKLYIVRYDEGFIQDMTEETSNKVKELNITGTIVCIYQLDKHVSKCIKHMSDYSVSFDEVNEDFVKKYLKSDFPNLSSKLVEFATKHSSDYKGAWNICNSLNQIAGSNLLSCDDNKLLNLFGYVNVSTELQIKMGLASKNFKYLVNIIENMSDELDSVFYIFINTLVELDKLVDNNYSSSELRDYAKNWTHVDIYNMICNVYQELKQTRIYSNYDIKNAIVYLLGLLQFSPIPSPEVML